MKKNQIYLYGKGISIHFKKCFLIMKLTAIIILIGCLHLSAKSLGQNQRISVDFRNSSIKEVFNEIERVSDYTVFYRSEDLTDLKKVNGSFLNKPVFEILDDVLKGTNFSYVLKNRVIVVLPKDYSEIMTQQKGGSVSGVITDINGDPVPGTTIMVKGTSVGTVSDATGAYTINVPEKGEILVFSFIGMTTQEIAIMGRTVINVSMEGETIGVGEVVVVGYGTQKKSDITGTVASVGQERLELVPNMNIAQAIQGAIPGVMMQTQSAGAAPEEALMIRGRNSIQASNTPLIVVDEIPYGGQLRDINPNDVKSIEVLKDASAAAIYGSRGANGVILVTTKNGLKTGKSKISYDGYYSVQKFTKLPDLMNGEEFYKFKEEREPGSITQSEQAIYDAGGWVDWLDLALRNGQSTEHNLSVSGGFQGTSYYISGGVTDIKGLAINDDYLRLTSRINIDTKVAGWLTIGTRTQLTYDDGAAYPRHGMATTAFSG
jgi:TonB-linked SusC/RagA family outer membrane protein